MNLKVIFFHDHVKSNSIDFHLQGHSHLQKMSATDQANLRSNYFCIQVVLTKPTLSLKSAGGSKGQWVSLWKETYGRTDCKTGHWNSWVWWIFAPQLSRGKNQYILHRSHIVSVLHSYMQYGCMLTWKKWALQQSWNTASEVHPLNWQRLTLYIPITSKMRFQFQLNWFKSKIIPLVCQEFSFQV